MLLEAATRALVLWPPSTGSLEPEPAPEPASVPKGWFLRQQRRSGGELGDN